MSLARIDQLLQRFAEASTTEAAEAALRELAALDAEQPELALEHEPLGDLYGELADDLFEHDEQDEALRLQRIALDHPCTNPRREIGTWLGYRYATGDREAAIADLVVERSVGQAPDETPEASDATADATAEVAGEPETDQSAPGAEGSADEAERDVPMSGPAGEAFIVGAFAEAVERVDAELAASLHDEALELATASDDEDVLAIIQVPRALLRRDLGFAPDADDIDAFRELESLGQRLPSAADDEAVQLFLPRDELEAATAKWPKEMAELGMDEPDAFYRELELFWRDWPSAGGAIVLRPLTVALLEAHGSTPAQPADEMPDALVEELEARDDGEEWPPGRNDECWCGSGRKYKKCCGAA